ncbi:hypothetical protein NGF19_27325 [Streptomyces sp. RY43-2]|uniref:Uncharacterized protein n=1 Tax=Streptomyces macrolidinus TaxID=2952607 RepID=A0ABT0ZLH9_9ACTN|nr:hypothetical protein [Streptomyces macrolidinus]MCN9244449.1 hypothetical protein [Streptomyces macrolidinus]
MTHQYGDAFDRDRAVADIEALLATPLPEAGPTQSEEDPVTEEWVKDVGEGFVLAPLWESGYLAGVPGEEWNAEVEGADLKALDVAADLTRRWGTPRKVAMHGAMFRAEAGEPVPPLHQALCDADNYGDLTVWGPVPAGPQGADRWVGISVGHCDDDAPLVLMAVVSDREIEEVEGGPDRDAT